MYKHLDTLTTVQVEVLHRLYQETWWSQGRTLADIHKMLSNSDYLFGICETRTQQLVAFARVLTDRVYRALIFDVIVAADYRHQGLGRSLIERIISHPDLSQVESLGFRDFRFIKKPTPTRLFPLAQPALV
ncbi:MAG: GNAT family N-acetyltransferase [Microcoleaceae cyanobacterium]